MSFSNFPTGIDQIDTKCWETFEPFYTELQERIVTHENLHWVYTNPHLAINSTNCDAKWVELWERFIPDVDYSGLENECVTGWHRKLHIFHIPFYYIEYGLAQVGALQMWRNALDDQTGTEFRFDTDMLADLVDLVEKTIEELEASIEN